MKFISSIFCTPLQTSAKRLCASIIYAVGSYYTHSWSVRLPYITCTSICGTPKLLDLINALAEKSCFSIASAMTDEVRHVHSVNHAITVCRFQSARIDFFIHEPLCFLRQSGDENRQADFTIIRNVIRRNMSLFIHPKPCMYRSLPCKRPLQKIASAL